MDQHYSLNELAELVDMEPRTIRSYIAQGLLKGPDRMGRGARYDDTHLRRLQAIRAYRDLHGLALADIRAALLSLDESGIEAMAQRWHAGQQLKSAPLPNRSPSALDYLQQVRESLGGDWSNGAPPNEAPEPAEGPLERLIKELEQLQGGRVKAKARGVAWFDISITPDLKLRARGVRSPAELARLERLADCLRELLLGG